MKTTDTSRSAPAPSTDMSTGKSIGKSIGVSAFGLDDAVRTNGAIARSCDCLPGCVILPNTPLGSLAAGAEAAESRVCSGLHWPLDAQVDEEDIRRVPVSAAWKRLTDSRNGAPRWRRKTVSFPVSNILAAHILALLKENALMPGSGDHCCLVIPNHLDMFAQEALLRSLKSAGLVPGEMSLLWRPVAAALAWLSQISPDEFSAPENGERERILMAYAGLDGLELTMLELEKCTSPVDGKDYIQPIRSRPEPGFRLTGLDLALNLAESTSSLCQGDPGALWQTVFGFPQIWQLLRGQTVDPEPRPWSTQAGWRLWSPLLSTSLMEENVGPHPLASRLCGTRPVENDGHDGRMSWQNFFITCLASVWDAKRRPVGGVLYGPLAHLVATHPNMDKFVTSAPTRRRYWLAQDDCMALGAVIYADRLAAGLPTYLDTLPNLEVLYQTRTTYDWAALVDSNTVEGGRPYQKSLPGLFQLKANKIELAMYLCLGNDNEERKKDPGQGLAQDRDRDNIRKSEVLFPEAPMQDEPIRLDVRMRPASGLAQVDLVPENSTFLGGRKIPFDFERMEPSEMPRFGRGYPENLSLHTSPMAMSWTRRRQIDHILYWSTANFSNLKSRNALLKDLQWLRNAVFEPGDRVAYAKIDQDGKTATPEGDRIIAAIADKVDELWYYFRDSTQEQKFITRATYLWRATPQSVVDGLFKILKNRANGRMVKNFHFIMEAAARCFMEKEHCRMLFLMGIEENRWKTNFNSIRAMYRLLSYCPQAKTFLDDTLAYELVDTSMRTVEEQINLYTIKKKFFMGAYLFLEALMQRVNNRTFMSATEDERAKNRYDKMSALLEKAKSIVKEENDEHIAELLTGIQKYMDYDGELDLIERIQREAEEGEEEDVDD